MKKLLSFIGFSILSLIVFIAMPAFSGQAFAKSSKAANASYDYIKGQLIVSVEADSQKKFHAKYKQSHASICSAETKWFPNSRFIVR
ncbi:hypothetical protein RWE15_08995 [Virgibacillus halophilus]|uniref:Uncharacterized protein n=1 Tax=Tigheibacillus halophilus TaxID=361280 RepID=A0ABU5C796_9BACI|nr:hypothetical protein [Virgibacillus halophilus]